MDDPKSRKQIDELADLYLTGVINDEDSKTEDSPPSPVEGPAPIRLSPKPTNDDAAASRSDEPPPPLSLHEEPEDRHPVLRLTDRESENPPVTDEIEQGGVATAAQPTLNETEVNDLEPAPQAALEAALLGNLPGMSGPWLTQYAQLIAQTEGPVAVLHVGENAIDLELVEPRAESEPAPAAPTSAVRIPPMHGNKTGLLGLLDALTRSQSAPIRTILVRMDNSTEALSLSRLAAIDDWTLLCGADDASVAGAGQQLRSLVRADPRLADRHVGLMVMGSDETTALSAAEKVAQDVEQDLANDVQFVGHLKRMQPVQVREIGSFPDPVSIWPQLVAWFDTLEAPEPTPILETIIPTPQPTPAPQPTARSSQEPKPQRLSPAAAKLLATPASRPEPRPAFTPTTAPPTPRPRPRPAATQPQPARTQQVQHPAAPTSAPAVTSRKPAALAEPTRPAPQPRVLSPQPELDLIALLAQGPAALNDPAPLEARIPDQPDTQLAVDTHGVVHILLKKVSDTIDGPFDGGDAASLDPRQAVMQLIEAGQWVREHLELLALTQRDRTFIDQDPTLHLMTDRADLSTQLVGKLAGQVKLHLLQQVQLGKASGWFCTPLG